MPGARAAGECSKETLPAAVQSRKEGVSTGGSLRKASENGGNFELGNMGGRLRKSRRQREVSCRGMLVLGPAAATPGGVVHGPGFPELSERPWPLSASHVQDSFCYFSS